MYVCTHLWTRCNQDYISALTKDECATLTRAQPSNSTHLSPSLPPAPEPKLPSGPKPPPPSYQSRMPSSSMAARSRFRNIKPTQPSATAIPSPHKKAPTHSAPCNSVSDSTATFKAVGKQNDGDAIDLLALTKAQLYDFLVLNDLTGYATQFLREGVNGNDLAVSLSCVHRCIDGCGRGEPPHLGTACMSAQTFDNVDFEDFSGLNFQLRKLKRWLEGLIILMITPF